MTPTSQNALFRYAAAREARDQTPPPACGALWKVTQLGKCARATPRQAAGGGCAGDPQASAWGLTARKSAVWAEGLADGAPWARPGHHQAAMLWAKEVPGTGASRVCVGGCVTVLAAWWASPPGGATQECTQIGETGLSVPFWGTCVHCCAVVDRRRDARVYTDRRKRPLGAVLGHLCTLL